MNYTIKEAAEQTNLPETAVRRAIVSGDLKAFRLGKGKTSPYYVGKEDLEAWLGAAVSA